MTDKTVAFGRRENSRAPAPSPLPDMASPPLSPSLRDRQITAGQWAVIAGLGIVAILIGGIATVRAFSGPAPGESGFYPLVESSLRQVGAPSPALREAHETCANRSIGGRRKFEGYTPAAEGETLLLQHVHYLNCITGERVERFCNARDREHLRHAVASYFTLLDRVRATWERGPKTIRMTVSFGPTPRPMPKRPSYPSDRTDPTVVVSLQRLIERGYLTQSDLGGFAGWRMPGDLGEALRGVVAYERNCA